MFAIGSNVNSKTTIAILASVGILAAAIAPAFVTQASAKISPPSCETSSGQAPSGLQP